MSESFPSSSVARCPPKCVSVAGFDPLSFAGATADLRTFTLVGVQGFSVITSLTVQTIDRFFRCCPVDSSVFSEQFRSIFDQFGSLPIKIGLIPSIYLINNLSSLLASYQYPKVVLDPVFAPSAVSVASLRECQSHTVEKLFPLASLVTPNILEAERILDRPISHLNAMAAAASDIHARFGCSVLLKGGHLPSQELSVDILCHQSLVTRFESPRASVSSIHGSGCFLSASITAFLALGFDIPSAVRLAKEHISKAFSDPVDMDGFPLLHSSP
ncbi:MAG: Pyridoxine kinase [Verrucomicrobia subdivision 3 bacterium]|nr:Pyridoxine kinase [Limisphaerales bacterium]MCS1415857.1 Pyridoxine kinase [Limisphaerales bacterium]